MFVKSMAVGVLSRTFFLSALCMWSLMAWADPAPSSAVDHLLADKPLPKVVSAQQAVESPDIPTIDPTTLNEAEINKVLATEARCDFSYTSAGNPILATTVGADGRAKGVLKIHGRLVVLTSDKINNFESLKNGGTFDANPIEFSVDQVDDNKDHSPSATALFRIKDEFTVGYKGFYRCRNSAG